MVGIAATILRAVRTLLLGEALVDMVRERPDVYVPHAGGAVANVAMVAARLGADVALAGGAGADEWGRWLRRRLEADGVALDWFVTAEDLRTPVAFVTLDPAGEPSFQVYGEDIAATIVAVAPRLEEAIEACGAVFVSSNTLVADDERAVTMAARARALEGGKPVVFD